MARVDVVWGLEMYSFLTNEKNWNRVAGKYDS